MGFWVEGLEIRNKGWELEVESWELGVRRFGLRGNCKADIAALGFGYIE